MKTLLLYLATALAEIVDCYLPWLWLRQGAPAWLLTLHAAASGRVYAAYGGVYIRVAGCGGRRAPLGLGRGRRGRGFNDERCR